MEKEPKLLPLSGEHIRGNSAEEARLDVSAVGFWRPQERMFLDVRVFDPNCKSYRDMAPENVYRLHENAKKADYNERVLQVERASMTPLIFSTSGGEGKEAARFHNHRATLVSEKRGEKYSTVKAFMRKKIRFCLLRTTLESLRGARSLKRRFIDRSRKVIDVDIMNTIDNRDSDKINYIYMKLS